MSGSAHLAGASPQQLVGLAQEALQTGREREVLHSLLGAATRTNHPQLWRWTGLLQQALDEHEAALESLTTAARLAPAGPRIAYERAVVALEAGLPSVALFEQAMALAPRSGAALIGLASARAEAGEAARAASDLQQALLRAPNWVDGHEYLAKLLASVGRPEEATTSLEQALRDQPQSPELWGSLFNVHLRAGRYEALREAVARAAATRLESPELPIYEAICAAEFAPETHPPALFDQAPTDADAILDTWRIRHLLRVGAPEAALPIVDRALRDGNSAETWAYAATTWRMTEDARADWLEGQPALVQEVALESIAAQIDRIAETLRTLHVGQGEYPDQSVRGGTQTPGQLFTRIDAVIGSLRAEVVRAVETYVSRLPAADPRHPLLRERRDRSVRFAGSWSVRLRGGGRHANHVHPQGWISSALYIALPPRHADDAANAGWLTLGEPDDTLGLSVGPRREVEPRVAHLVLFPSWMWHGTRPFSSGERMTVAFDVRPPS